MSGNKFPGKIQIDLNSKVASAAHNGV